MVNKKGQEMSITTLILIVLGIAILVLIIIGFSIGWSNLAEKFNIFKPSSNIDDLVQSCNVALTQPGAYCEYKLVTLASATGASQRQYVSCEDSRIVAKLQSGAAPPCDVTAAQFCSGKPATTIVNGKLCSGLAKCTGVVVDSAACTPQTNVIQGTYGDVTPGKVCCKPNCVGTGTQSLKTDADCKAVSGTTVSGVFGDVTSNMICCSKP